MKRRPLALCLLLVLGACAGGPDPLFVGASRMTYDAIAPEYRNYVNADPALSSEQKQRRRDTLDRWNEAITVRERR